MGMLTLSLAQGEGFWLLRDGKPDQRWALEEVYLARGFVLRSDDGQEFAVGSDTASADEEVEICDKVWVSDGHRHIVGRARVVVNAPQSIMILRDELYVERKRKEAERAAA